MSTATVPQAGKWGPHTFEDLLKTPEDEKWELINGYLVMAPESGGNRGLVGKIYHEIEGYLEDHPLGFVRLDVGFEFQAAFASGRQWVVPDLCYVCYDQSIHWNDDAPVQKNVIPALTVEILSPSNPEMDLETKVEIYRQAGVQEYWIFDRHEQSVRIFRFAESPDKPVVMLTFNDTITTPLFPGFALDMPRIRRALELPGRGRRI